MKILVDACVLYPTVMREIVLGCATACDDTLLWSARILEEWARAAARIDPAQDVIARGEISLIRAKWPDAEIEPDPSLEQQLYLPDVADRHVLAAAICGQADVIMTMNLKDFPPQVLAEFALTARHPDAILRDRFDQFPAQILAVVKSVHAQAENLSGTPINMRKLLKKARLPRLGKAIENAAR